MSRPIPEIIAAPESCPIAIDQFGIEYAASMFDGAVTDLTSELGLRAEQGESFSWRSGGDLWDYHLECAGQPELIGGFLVNRWQLNRQPVVADEAALAYYVDAPRGTLEIFEDGRRRTPTPREVNGFYNAVFDLQAEIGSRRQGLRYWIVGGMVVPNPTEDE